MTMPRIDRLTAPPLVGQFYLVRTVRARFFTTIADWPVIGPQHEDREISGLSVDHYHLDWRFVPVSQEQLERRYSYVLHARTGEPPLPAAQWRRRKCIRSDLPLLIPWNAQRTPVDKVREIYAGRQCLRNAAGGFICPHRQAPISSIYSHEGVIICPLHGLRIDAATGVVLAPEQRP